MTPGQLAHPDAVGPPLPTQPKRGATMIKWQVLCCRTREPLSDPMFSKSHAESLAEKLSKKGRAAIVDRVEV